MKTLMIKQKITRQQRKMLFKALPLFMKNHHLKLLLKNR